MEKKKQKGSILLKYWLSKTAVKIILVIIVLLVIALGVGKYFMTESKTAKIGFEDIGELATQSAYCTEVNVTEAARELFGVEIPFTESKYIYSYDIVIKAGFNFEEIEWELNDHRIEVKLPETKILSSEINLDSFKLYHEDESIFRQITMDENNEALKSMQENAETGRFISLHSSRQYGADRSAQHIAAAGGSQVGGAGGVDRNPTVRSCHDRSV